MGRVCSTKGGRIGMHADYWWEGQNEIDHWEDKDIGGQIILRWILERLNLVFG
jgi:hypothetical protein